MADPINTRSCHIVLHDDRVSHHDVLGGADITTVGTLAYLSSATVTDLAIIISGKANGPRDISVHVRLGTRLGLVNRTQGKLNLLRNSERVTASHVDLLLRDQVLSRTDMWHLTRQLDGQVLYRDSNIDYLGNVAASLQDLYCEGRYVQSALIQDGRTKSILRSGCARFAILVQISAEMLNDWNDSSLLYEHLIGFVQDLFQRWESSKARHLVSVILFGRVHGKDFLDVLNLDTPCSQGRAILLKLKAALNTPYMPHDVSLAASGNLLEVVNLTVAHFLTLHHSLYLAGTGSSIVVITAGSGHFHSDYALLNATTRVLLGHSIGVDIVSLAHRPTHPVPLFSYTLNGREEFALPHWADISYYAQPSSRFLPENCVMSELESIQIPHLDTSNLLSALELEAFDEATFSLTTNHKLDNGGTVAGARAKENVVPPAQTKLPSRLRQHPSTSSIATTISLSKQSKVNAISLLSNRKISVGPRGLAPLTTIASATVSTAYANHDRDLPKKFTPSETESGIAKQIRATLRKRPSQSSIMSGTIDGAEAHTQAIDIAQTPSTNTNLPPDVIAASIDSQQSSASQTRTLRGSSKTPRAFGGMVSSPQKQSLDPSVSALTPWLTLLNPCNMMHSNMRIAAQYRQWQHAFPKAVATLDVKWTSLCTPAALPLYNDLSPERQDLKKYYKRSTRRLVCPQRDGFVRTPGWLMQRLIALRLAHGFQLVTPRDAIDDSHVLMSIGADYHEIQCLSDVELEIVEYTYPIDMAQQKAFNPGYNVEVKSAYNDSSRAVNTEFVSVPSRIDWRSTDQEMEASGMSNILTSMKLVLLPVESEAGDGVSDETRGLAEDERRIEGIQRLTQQWQKHRVYSVEDRSHHVSISRKRRSGVEEEVDPNPLAIEYHTRDPSALVNAQESSLLGQTEADTHEVPLFKESDMYHSAKFDMYKLARQMQELPPQGVEMRDRRWFARKHYRCFRGDEMTSWLLGAFKDLHTREDAVDLGNELMKEGVFVHVRQKHAFLDGNYFYQIAPRHRTAEHPNAMASVFSRTSSRSIPPTPSSEVRMSPKVRSHRGDSESPAPDSTPSLPLEKKQVVLSQTLKYNVDSGQKSEYDEIIDIHYDRIHNPENAYHIYLDWGLTSARFIQDAITRWSNLVAGYGLRLRQLPILEACKHSELHPFEQPIYVTLARRPPEKIPATPLMSSTTSGSPRIIEDRAFFQKAVLRKLGFVLDLESSDSYSGKLDVVVAWGSGKMDYSMTQYVHRSGLVMAQVAKRRPYDFLLLPNTLAAVRGHGYTAGRSAQTSESVLSVLQSVRRLADDAKALAAIYDEASKSRPPAASPFSRALHAHPDADVPPMQLPPHLLHRVFP